MNTQMVIKLIEVARRFADTNKNCREFDGFTEDEIAKGVGVAYILAKNILLGRSPDYIPITPEAAHDLCEDVGLFEGDSARIMDVCSITIDLLCSYSDCSIKERVLNAAATG